MAPKMAILVLPATAIVLALILHSVKYRGAKDTLLFFSFATLFGIARGNVIWWITTVHFDSKFPYIFQKQLLGVYHDSLTADAGWIICLYIGSYMALRISERLPHLRGKLFPMVSLACLFNACLSYAVEASAMTMGWWQWNLSTRSAILLDVPMVGIIAWFSVGFDFLIPYYTIRHYRKPGQWWPFLTILIFPLHMAAHLFNDRVSALMPITPYNIWHWGMVLAVLVLPFVSGIRMRRPWLPYESAPRAGAGDAGRRIAFARLIPAAGLGVMAVVLLISDLLITGRPGLLISKVPLAVYSSLALPFLNPLWVLAAAAAMTIMGGKLFAASLIPPAFYFALRGMRPWPRPAWLRLIYALIPIVLTGFYYNWNVGRDRVDRQYWTLVGSGLRVAERGEPEEAIERLSAAAELKPNSLPALEKLVVLYSQTKQYDKAEEILRRMLDLRPISEEIHANMGNVKLLRGDPDEAEAWFTKALEINPSHEYSRRMLEEIERIRSRRREQ